MSFQICLFILLTYFALLWIKPRVSCTSKQQASTLPPWLTCTPSLVLSIKACALLDQAQGSPALLAHCTEDKQEGAGNGSLDQGQSSGGGASWEEVSRSWSGSPSRSNIFKKVNWVGEDFIKLWPVNMKTYVFEVLYKPWWILGLSMTGWCCGMFVWRETNLPYCGFCFPKHVGMYRCVYSICMFSCRYV